ncbi:hypothetical protein ACIA8K_40365 [Catenuloplanes sp. NPDC051500]|uniref:hypothetical protein n=1 Tax=Catenuloplanes sp. NPDC051500 TaxID=3363959 RepID=UPI003792564B
MRPGRRVTEIARWVALGGATALLGVFLIAQGRGVEVSYAQSPSSTTRAGEGSADELSGATVPTTEEMSSLVAAAPVVRLPGAVARWDTTRVDAAIGGSGLRILVAPPGLDEAARTRVKEVANADITVVGTQVSAEISIAVPDTAAGWRAEFAAGDVTNRLLTIIASIQDRPLPADVEVVTWRAPTAAELEPVVADLRATGLHLAPGATLTKPTSNVASAFPDRAPLIVALPRQDHLQLPRYAASLAPLFPDTPIIVMHGAWIEYAGPHAADFSELAAATFYGRVGDRLAVYAYPQANVLYGWLDRVTDVRYSGLFERPLPYQPFDPLRVALPALPWLFALCVAVFLALTARAARRPAERRSGAPASRLAALTALAVEMHPLADRATGPALTRALTTLTSARDAIADELPDAHVRALLDAAERELDDAARTLPFPGYRPVDYLRGRLA